MTRIKQILLLAVFLSGTNAFSQILPGISPEKDSLAFAKVQARMDSIRQYRPTVGLALAGGGACGLAHLGVIKYLEELGIPVDIVTGTSMGGLVAGFYSLGYKQSQLDSLVRAIDWPVMMSDDIPDNYIGYRLRKYRERFVIRIPWKYDQADAEYLIRRRQKQAETLFGESVPVSMGVGVPDGYLFGLNVRNLLSSVSVGYQDSISFADLPIPFACVATDLYSMKPKYWTGGSITSALRSTMAIPLLFRPVRENGEILLDGGMINNFPADIAKAMGADIIIGSEMADNRELDELNSPVDLLMQTITMMSTATFEPAGKLLSVRVHHDLKDFNLLSFDAESVDDIIRKGYQCAREYKKPLESIASVVGGKGSPSVHRKAPAVNLAQKKVHVGDVRFTGIAEGEKDRILHRSDYPKDGMYDRDVVEKMLNKIYGTNAFEAVSYHMEGKSEPYSLVFDCQKGQVNDFAIGIRADTDEYVAALLHLGLGTRRLSGPRLTADVKLGTNPSLTLDGSIQSGAGLPTVGITLRNRLINTLSGDLSDIDERLFTMAADIYLSDSRIRFGEMKAGLTAEMDPYEHYLSEGEMWQGYDLESFWLSAFVNLKYDNFDDGFFPTRGLRLSLKARQAFKGYSIDLDPSYSHTAGYTVTDDGSVPAYLSAMASAEGAFSIGQSFTILPKLYAGWYSKHRDYLNPKHIVYMGGFMQDRYAERQIPFFGFQSGCRECLPFSASAQLDLRCRFSRKDYISVRGGIFGDDYTFQDLIHSAPVFAFGVEYSRRSIVGPLKVAFQHCNISGFTAHASIGFDF